MNVVTLALTLALTATGVGIGRSAAPTRPAEDLGPQVVVLNDISRVYGPVRFDHKLHVGMASIRGSCANCHHDLKDETGIKPGQVARACNACHEPASDADDVDKPGLRGAYHRQCLSCHQEWAGENACGFCHEGASDSKTASNRLSHHKTSLMPRLNAEPTYRYNTSLKSIPLVSFHHADHAQRFGLRCADCHGGSACSECHGPNTVRPVVKRRESCYTCHNESRCITCHGLQERGRFDHAASTGWRLRPGHATLACDACHEAGSMPQQPLSYTCKTCHARRWNDKEFDHSRTGVVLDGDHALYECVSCHSGGDDRMLARCDSCHKERVPIGERRVGRQLGSPIEPNAQR